MPVFLKSKNQGALKKSFYLLTKQLMEIEDSFNIQIQAKITDELNHHQQYVLSTCKSLNQLNKNIKNV